MKHWFYLEPYTFLFRNAHEAVVYNTLNGAYLKCPEVPEIEHILDVWDDAANGYGILLDETDLKKQTVRDFIHEVRDTFSGDCVEYVPGTTLPYLFKPTLFLNAEIRVKEEKEKTSLGEHILENLNEVTLFFSGKCSKGGRECSAYFRQMDHCTVFEREEELPRETYVLLLRQLQQTGIQKVNFCAGGDPIANRKCVSLLSEFSRSAFKKHLWLDGAFLNNAYIDLSQATDSVLEVSVCPSRDGDWIRWIQEWQYPGIRWKVLVTDEADMERIAHADIPETVSMQIYPFFTGTNWDFFRDYVFVNKEDLLAEPISRKTIFRHRALNDQFFGKLYLTPEGDIYPNMNGHPLGNIREMALKEAVYKEIAEGAYWLKSRHEAEPCRNCVNRDLCPSISNYELVTGKADLCHI